MERTDLPSPASLHDIYMHDQCLSLRALVDLLTPKAPEPQADAPVELREPAKSKPKHRDQMLEQAAKEAPTESDLEAKPTTKAK